MLTWAEIRASMALWLVGPAMVYVLLYIDDAALPFPSGYGVESGELAAHAVVVIAPVVAAAAAWAAGRHRHMEAMALASPRRRPVQVLRATAPAWILHGILAVGAVVMARLHVGVWPSGSGWLAVAHVMVLPVGWLFIGWWAGRLLPRSIAAPLVGAGCWTWMAFSHAISIPWVRHLAGFVSATSPMTDVQRPSVYVVPWCAAAGLAAAVRVLVIPHRRAVGMTSSVLVLCAVLAGGRWTVADWGYGLHTAPRDIALACAGQAPRVCAPPEYGPYVEELRRDSLEPIARLRAAGIPAPEELRITSRESRIEPGVWPLYGWMPPAPHPEGTTGASTDALIGGAIAGTAARSGVTDCEMPGTPVGFWAALVITGDDEAVRAGMLPEEWDKLRAVRQKSPAEQARWFTDSVVSRKYCSNRGQP
ncbi:hypothetical protein ACF1G0_11370 [Streptomyces sp. NPDC013953]|uniref:DUF7224 domain-containing protein n=1 Tax=Streptomyces sp. NPDC013953 TaxID=3364868 RepID=UPI0036F8014A